MDIAITPKFDSNGLLPAIIQDMNTGDVLMVAWMNEEAFNLTLKTRQVVFWSRSRQGLWKKGETSGNTLIMHEMWFDCDSDTVLIKATPSGPVCHTGNKTCFFQQLL